MNYGLYVSSDPCNQLVVVGTKDEIKNIFGYFETDYGVYIVKAQALKEEFPSEISDDAICTLISLGYATGNTSLIFNESF